ncbi:hypothetical protein [Rhodanobacter sp. OK091]|uniref:hypothetical protein n=1 Tax=Rhodanobacter sp. OK091 TaxID=1881037 RepID=UPI0009352F2C|nr:hypothetical protein [Rhodanobacter sp. OK091]
MPSKFEDIKIVAMDDEASYKSEPNTQMVHVVLTLSASAPHEWAQYFDGRWQQQFYMMKRRASVLGKRLEIYCVPDELQRHHIPELNKVIAETNATYRSYVEKAQRAAAERDAADSRERAELADLKSKLKFD